MWSKIPDRDDRVFFPVALGAMGLLGAVLILCTAFPRLAEALRWTRPCPFYTLTGLYCPGCGGQRAFKALLRGDMLASLYCHAAVLPTALYLLFYAGSQALNRLSRGRTKALCFKGWHLLALSGILVLQWLIKNILLKAGIYALPS